MSTVEYVTCPQCGDPFTEPLLPASASYRLVRTHTRGAKRNTCRVVLTVHPDGRTESEVVPTPLTLEEALAASASPRVTPPIESSTTPPLWWC
jgi:hypothetical protein